MKTTKEFFLQNLVIAATLFVAGQAKADISLSCGAGLVTGDGYTGPVKGQKIFMGDDHRRAVTVSLETAAGKVCIRVSGDDLALIGGMTSGHQVRVEKVVNSTDYTFTTN